MSSSRSLTESSFRGSVLRFVIQTGSGTGRLEINSHAIRLRWFPRRDTSVARSDVSYLEVRERISIFIIRTEIRFVDHGGSPCRYIFVPLRPRQLIAAAGRFGWEVRRSGDTKILNDIRSSVILPSVPDQPMGGLQTTVNVAQKQSDPKYYNFLVILACLSLGAILATFLISGVPVWLGFVLVVILVGVILELIRAVAAVVRCFIGRAR